MAHAPIVFISSTSDDLKDYRQAAAKAARGLGFFPLMMEDLPANGRAPSLDECRRQVEQAELLIAIVAHRYGWVPNSQFGTVHSNTFSACRPANSLPIAFAPNLPGPSVQRMLAYWSSCITHPSVPTARAAHTSVRLQYKLGFSCKGRRHEPQALSK